MFGSLSSDSEVLSQEIDGLGRPVPLSSFSKLYDKSLARCSGFVQLRDFKPPPLVPNENSNAIES